MTLEAILPQYLIFRVVSPRCFWNGIFSRRDANVAKSVDYSRSDPVEDREQTLGPILRKSHERPKGYIDLNLIPRETQEGYCSVYSHSLAEVFDQETSQRYDEGEG